MILFSSFESRDRGERPFLNEPRALYCRNTCPTCTRTETDSHTRITCICFKFFVPYILFIRHKYLCELFSIIRVVKYTSVLKYDSALIYNRNRSTLKTYVVQPPGRNAQLSRRVNSSRSIDRRIGLHPMCVIGMDNMVTRAIRAR